MLVGELKKHPTIMHWPIEILIQGWKVITDEEASALAKIVETPATCSGESSVGKGAPERSLV